MLHRLSYQANWELVRVRVPFLSLYSKTAKIINIEIMFTLFVHSLTVVTVV